MRRRSSLLALLVLAACQGATPMAGATPAGSSRYLFAWAAGADSTASDFLAVLDVDSRSPTFATVVATAPVGLGGTRPHHTEYEMPADGVLWANGFAADRTFRFDLRDPRQPRLAGVVPSPAPFGYPHSFVRLPNGHRLATLQFRSDDARPETGGLVEFDTAGRVVRQVSAAVPGIDTTVRPYSLAVVPALDRVVTTATDMSGEVDGRAVQIWRLSDLTLLQTLLLPPGPRGDEQWLSAEPRVLADGRTVLVNTFQCGLYRLRGLDTDSVSAEWVYSTPWTGRPYCSVPVVVGHFWLQPNGPEHAVVTLDVSDPDHPREVSRLALQPDEVPHWLGAEPGGRRVVITGYKALESRVLLARLDPVTGALALDSSFTTPGADRPGVDLSRQAWPHGGSGKAIPHGAVFSRP